MESILMKMILLTKSTYLKRRRKKTKELRLSTIENKKQERKE
jgi:hypothetical protein